MVQAVSAGGKSTGIRTRRLDSAPRSAIYSALLVAKSHLTFVLVFKKSRDTCLTELS